MANFGGSVNIASRMRGSQDALADIGIKGQTSGIDGLSSQIKDLNVTRTGAKAEKPPKAEIQPQHAYTTSGATINPKVASIKLALQTDAPNYGIASSATTSCTKCKFYRKQDKEMGYCDKYDFYAREDYTCDNWRPEKGGASHFIRQKLR
jgi:hypothetical protein